MANVTDLNERLKEKARAELKGELEAAARPFLARLNMGHSVDAGLRDAKGNQVEPWKAIEMIVGAVFEMRVRHREQEAIDEFIEKVDKLQDQINQLTSVVGGD